MPRRDCELQFAALLDLLDETSSRLAHAGTTMSDAEFAQLVCDLVGARVAESVRHENVLLDRLERDWHPEPTDGRASTGSPSSRAARVITSRFRS